MKKKKTSAFHYSLLEIAGKTEGWEPKTEAEERQESIDDVANQLRDLVTPDGKPITNTPEKLASKLLKF